MKPRAVCAPFLGCRDSDVTTMTPVVRVIINGMPYFKFNNKLVVILQNLWQEDCYLSLTRTQHYRAMLAMARNDHEMSVQFVHKPDAIVSESISEAAGAALQYNNLNGDTCCERLHMSFVLR